MTTKMLLELVAFTGFIWFLWAMAMFTDTVVGRAAIAVGGAFGRGVIAGLFPLTGLAFTSSILVELIGPTGFYATIPGAVLLGILLLIAVISVFSGLVVWIFDVDLPEWAYPEYHARRRRQRRVEDDEVKRSDMYHVASHPDPEASVRVSAELVSPNALRVRRPWSWYNSALRSVLITVNGVRVGRIWNGQTRLFPLPKGDVAVYAVLDWATSDLVYSVLPEGHCLDVTLTFASPDKMFTNPNTYLRLHPTNPDDGGVAQAGPGEP